MYFFFLSRAELLIVIIKAGQNVHEQHGHNIRHSENGRRVFGLLFYFNIRHLSHTNKIQPVNVLNIHSNCIWDHKLYLWLSGIHKNHPSQALILSCSALLLIFRLALSCARVRLLARWQTHSIFMQPSHAKWLERKSDNSKYRIPNTRLQITFKIHRRSWFTVLSTHFARYFHYFMQMLNLV